MNVVDTIAVFAVCVAHKNCISPIAAIYFASGYSG